MNINTSFLWASLLLAPTAWAADCAPAALTRTYANMLRSDQALRGRYIAILEKEFRKEQVDTKAKARLEDRIWRGDQAHQRALDRLIARCGWPNGLDENRAARAAFFVIQHGELDYQLKYADLLKASHARGEIASKTYAQSVDRVLVMQGKPQLYGTEIAYGSNKMAPVADPAHLNERRRTMGLAPLPGDALP